MENQIDYNDEADKKASCFAKRSLVVYLVCNLKPLDYRSLALIVLVACSLASRKLISWELAVREITSMFTQSGNDYLFRRFWQFLIKNDNAPRRKTRICPDLLHSLSLSLF